MSTTSNTRSIYIDSELWERLVNTAQRVDGLSTSQLIENILKSQISAVEAHLTRHEGKTPCPVCMTS